MSRKKPLSVDVLWQIERLGAPALAPDGRHAVCAATTCSLAKNRTSTSLWLLPTQARAPRRLTRGGDKDGQPAWSPRGDAIAFVARREQQDCRDTTPQLFLISPDGGEARRISDFGPGVESFKWLPDGRRIVFAAWVWPGLRGSAAQARAHKAFAERRESAYVTGEAFYRHWDHAVPMGRVLHLHLLDVASGKVTDLFEGTAHELPRDAAGNEVFDVRADGERIAFLFDPAPVPLAANRLALAEIDPRSRAVTTLVDDPAWDIGAPRYHPHGDWLAVTAANVGRAHTGLARLAFVSPRFGLHLPAVDPDLSVNAPLRWSAAGDAVFFTAEQRGRCHLWRHAVAGEGLTLAHGGGWVQGFDVAADVIVVAADDASHPVQIAARHGDAPPRRLERFNDSLLKDVAFGAVSEVSVEGALGEPVQMWLTAPVGFDPKRRHPLLQVIHGGPFAAAGDTFSYRWNPHLFAARGDVVAQVNYHGSSGFGWKFRHSLIGRQGELELQDIEAASDWLLAQPWADAERLSAAGGSYGGFLVAWMNGHVPGGSAGRYRAHVCHAGVFDRVATFAADSWPTRPKDLAANYWQDMPRVLAQSPHAFAAAMRTPTLVIHGAQDFRVPDCNGLAYYNTLKARGVDARLLWFPDENHWVLQPRNSKLWYAEFRAWLDTHSPRRRRKSG